MYRYSKPLLAATLIAMIVPPTHGVGWNFREMRQDSQKTLIAATMGFGAALGTAVLFMWRKKAQENYIEHQKKSTILAEEEPENRARHGQPLRDALLALVPMRAEDQFSLKYQSTISVICSHPSLNDSQKILCARKALCDWKNNPTLNGLLTSDIREIVNNARYLDSHLHTHHPRTYQELRRSQNPPAPSIAPVFIWPTIAAVGTFYTACFVLNRKKS